MNKEYYNSVSDFELQKGGYYFQKIDFFEKELARVKRRSNKEIRILDLACNDGKLSRIYSKYGKVTGVDLNELAVTQAKENGIEAIFCDVLSLQDIPDLKEFDVVVAGDIIEHIFNTDLFLSNANSVLKKGGTLLISTPNLVSLGRRMMSLVGKNPYCEYSSEKSGVNVGHVRYYTYKNIKDQLQRNGFGGVLIKSDTLNLPIKFLDKIMANFFPKLGRELLAVCYKK